MKTLLVLLLLMVGCAKPSETITAIEGEDLSGTYRMVEVRCYSDNTLSATTARAEPDSTSPTTNVTITGNSYQSRSIDPSCIATTKGRIVFTSSSDTVNFSEQTTTTSTAADCTHTTTLQSISGGTITPGSVGATTENNGTSPNSQASYVVSQADGSILLFSVFQVQGSPADLCFMVYLKL